ncbi:ABC transporter ATP-binding [Chlorella sorokiniana]|uniref:ABC transporter ATP-binding n=1 Tax=Chlorella sorokiniana TaxID=3076 RepID=A0A2P6TJW8_CHLSO|nr:ABC transporter ATP-binding [Chlorella sorokiniana]|eukprot:PRW44363.1 ABC transporter ATP-binding [Chlorella sorokiniana]
MGSAVTSLPFVLRFFEMITSIVAFAVVAEWAGWSKINYIIFTGVCGLVFALVFMVAYAAGAKAIRGKVSAAIDGLLVLFWLIAAAVATSILTVDDWSGSRIRSSVAFCWITFVLWIFSLVISIREMSGYEY